MSLIPFDDRDGFIWYDGRLIPWRDAKLHVLTHGLHYARCVFEGERVYGGHIFHHEQHNERLINSAKILGFEIPASMDDLKKASEESFTEKQRQNELSAAQRNAEAPQRAQNQATFDRKQADYQKKLADAAARGVQDAKEREDKAERFAAKQRDAAEHQAEVQARQKEAAAKQAQRAQQDAADRAHQEQLKQQQQQQQPK